MRKPSLLIIFLTVFIDLIGFGIVLPLLPRYSEQFGAEGWTIGAIIASFSVMQLFLAPWWGRWSDRIGRRPVLLISNAGSAVAYAMFAGAASPGLAPGVALAVLLASRVFAGACGANIAVAAAYIADITPLAQRSRGMGLIGVAFGLGFILGPAIGALSAQAFGLAGPGWVAAGLCAANFTLACFILVESRQPGSAPATPRPRLNQIAHTLRVPRVGLLVGVYFLSTFCFAVFESTLPLLLGSPRFHPDDFVRPHALAAKLRAGGDAVSAHLWTRLAPATREQLEQADQLTLGALRQVLYRGLNDILATADLARPPAAPEPALSPSLSRPTGEGAPATAGAGEGDSPAPSRPEARTQENRRVLEAAFPDELKRQPFRFDEQSVGFIFAYCGLLSAFIQGGVIGRLVTRFGEPRLIVGSLVIFALGMAMLPYAAGLGSLLGVLATVSVGSALNRAPTLGLVSIFSPVDEQGSSLGVTQSAGTLARIVGPVVATTLYAAVPHSPYWLAAAAALGGAVLVWWHLPHRVDHGVGQSG